MLGNRQQRGVEWNKPRGLEDDMSQVRIVNEATERGLSNSLFGVIAVCDERMVGCGRVVGDDGIYFYIQDIIVLPEYQGKGIGRAIMDQVMKYLRSRATPNAFIGLMAAKEVAEFYEKYGFAKRAQNRPGMFRVWE